MYVCGYVCRYNVLRMSSLVCCDSESDTFANVCVYVGVCGYACLYVYIYVCVRVCVRACVHDGYFVRARQACPLGVPDVFCCYNLPPFMCRSLSLSLSCHRHRFSLSILPDPRVRFLSLSLSLSLAPSPSSHRESRASPLMTYLARQRHAATCPARRSAD
jgi:hypothetical protein